MIISYKGNPGEGMTYKNFKLIKMYLCECSKTGIFKIFVNNVNQNEILDFENKIEICQSCGSKLIKEDIHFIWKEEL